MSDAPALAGITFVEDLDSAGDFEKKHAPFAHCERDGETVRMMVKVGHWVAHPNQPDHFIEWVEVLANGAPIARFDFTAVAVDPVVTCELRVAPGTDLIVMESCNLHGVWGTRAVAP